MPKDKNSGKKLADMMYGNPDRAAFGITPMIGKRREDRQDREAAKSFPVDLARGVVAGAVGLPGDIESLARLPYELYTGNESPTFLPTSEDVLKRIPFGTNTPAGQFASGLGTLAGGSANIGAIPRAVKAAPGALKTAAQNISAPRTLNPQAGVVRIGESRDVLPVAEREAVLAKSNVLRGADGKPLTVYHGTNQNIQSFDDKRLGQNTRAKSAAAHYFTESPQEAAEYANMSARRQIADAPMHEREIAKLQSAISQAEKRQDWDTAERLYAEMENLDLGAINADPSGQNIMPINLIADKVRVVDMADGFDGERVANEIRRAKEEQLHALKLENVYDPVGDRSEPFSTSQWIIFDPSRAKSAIGNRGTYDIEDPDITKAEGGSVRFSDNPDVMQLELAGGGLVRKGIKAIKSAAESAGQKAPVLAEKELTTLQDVHTNLGDRVRAGAMEAQKMMEGFDYKYDKGQRVFTKDSSGKNKPPYTILSRARVGNQVMREDHPEFGQGMGRPIIDPETGKAMRTPYEPGYRVRMERNPDDWSEFEIPEKAIVGDVEMAAGGAVHMQAGGLAKAAKALKAAKEAPMKASEALGRIEGRPLVITQADRTKVGGGFLGGPGFSGLQLEDPAYRAAEAAWAVKNPGTAKMILGGRGDSKDAVYAAMLGAPTQHQSNQMVFDKLLGDFKKAAKKGGLDPELRDRINMRLANSVDKDGNPVFPPDVDILDKKFKDLASTFDRRAVTANLIGGMGVGGKKGQIIDYDKIIRETTDPMLLESPTGALGNRLFTLSGGVIERPDLHPAFPTIMQGEDLGVSFDPVARELIMKDFMEKTMREKGRAPGVFDYTRGYPPSQLITEDILTELQKMGLKKGGAVRKAAGGEITADDLILEERKL